MRHAAAIALLALVGAACGGVTDPLGVGPVAPGPTEAVAELESAALEDFGCGYGFTVGTPEQTVRLSLWSGADHGEAPAPGSHDLGGEWTGQHVVGHDLFAQWCDDVVEPDEPEVVEDDSWEVAGTVTWELDEGDGQCPSVATATLTDGTVETTEGTVELPAVEFRNEYFGCFAG